MGQATIIGTTESLEQLAALRSAWSTTRAAGGGLAAMAGFDFQFTKAILTIIRQQVAGGGQTFVEALSDIVEADGGVVITQAKRTLSSSSLHSALGELWDIYRLAAVRTPALLPTLRFRVASERRTLIDWSASLARWTPDAADPDALADFKQRVTVSVEAWPRNEAARLLVVEFKDTDPFARVDRMLGELLRASAATLDAVVDAFRIELAALAEAARAKQRWLHLWGTEDRPPASVVRETNERLAVRLGERLTIADLREGRLGDRAVYDEIAEDCERWLIAERDPFKLPAYWISGRSGCGKSAALLHLAARLFSHNPDRIILWLGERVERVAEAVRWASPHIKAGKQLILALDDPFTAARQEQFAQSVEDAQDEWEAIRASPSSEESGPPVILCCGPTEQREAAEDGCGAHIACDGFALPIETPEDLAELAAWFSARTGREVPPLLGNVLLVQQMFEWTKGDIGDFAARFRDRICQFDKGDAHELVFSTIAQILALNRLYVEYPARDLAEKRRDNPALDHAFIALADEEAHLDFSSAEEGGVRLTHPHLADAIYMRWFGRHGDRAYRRGHLAVALGAALAQHDQLPEVRHAPLWSIARLARREDRAGGPLDPQMIERIDVIRDELRSVLSDVYASRSDSVTPLEDLPVWVTLADELPLTLTPPPAQSLMAAISAVDAPSRGLRLSCHRLLATAGEADAAARQACVADCLNRLADWRGLTGAWHDWVPLAIDFVRRVGPEAIAASVARLVRSGTSLPRLPQLVHMLLGLPLEQGRPIALSWLQRNPSSSPGWGGVLQHLQDSGQCDESDAVAQRFLGEALDDPSWAFVWLNLLDGERCDRATLVEDAIAWIGLRRGGEDYIQTFDNFGWDRVFQRLLKELTDRPEDRLALLRLGLRWVVSVDPDHSGWTYVWESLWKCDEVERDPEMRSQMIELALINLRLGRPSLFGWSYVWSQALAEADAERGAELVGIGHDWLKIADPTHQGWAWVWQDLVARSDPASASALLARGRSVLFDLDLQSPNWPHIWRDLAKRSGAAGDTELMAAGLAWLLGADPKATGYGKVMLELISADQGDVARQAIEIALPWLKDQIDQPLWWPVLEACQTRLSQPDREALADHYSTVMASGGIAGDIRARAWDGARLLGMPFAELAVPGAAILECPDTPVEAKINLCGRCARNVTDPAQRAPFVEQGLRLLISLDRKGWWWLWDALSRKDDFAVQARLLELAPAWLLKAGHSHPNWSLIYLRAIFLQRPLAEVPALRAETELWLANPASPAAWIKVWRTVANDAGLLDRPEIRARAMAAVAAHLDDPHWSRLWVSLFDSEEGDRDSLVRFGRKWLRRPEGGAGWGMVWRRVKSVTTDSGELGALDDLARAILTVLPPVGGWFELFEAFRKQDLAVADVPDLRAACDHWLSVPRVAKSWIGVWKWRRRLLPSPWQDEGNRGRILRWIGRTGPTDPLWPHVCASLLNGLPANDLPAIKRRALDWLGGTGFANGSWPYLWRAFWGLADKTPEERASLRSLGERWLGSHARHQAAHLVASRLRPPHRRNTKGKTPDVATGGR